MYDQTTADLIRSTPPLPDLDRESLPDRFTEAFARIVALRVRLRDGEGPPEELGPTRNFAQKLARTNEALVGLSPDREDRRSAAFVAATAYQLVHQIDHLSGIADSRASLTANGVTADVSAMLLFLVAECSADATEISQRIRLTDPASLEYELLLTLVELARGEVNSTSGRSFLPTHEAVRAAEPDAAPDALYYLILQAVRLLASSLAGRPRGADDPSALLRRAQTLAAPAEFPSTGLDLNRDEDPLDLGPVALFPGPFHLASLLLAVADTLTGAAIVNVAPPHGLDPDRWRSFLEKVAEERPYVWPNLQDAIANRYLDPGISSVIAFPTGAGKSGVSHLKIGATLLARRRVVFLAPTHALVDQTVRDLSAAFPGRRVRGEREDEFFIATNDKGPADIQVMTPEACLLGEHLRPSTFDGVGLLVFDECHLIHARDAADQRSVDAMLCITNFVRLVPEADLLLMSAMIKNADELAAWLGELTGRTALDFSMAWKPTRQLRGCVVYPQQRVNELNDLLKVGRQRKRTKNVPVALKRQLTAQPHGFFSIRQTWASQRREDYAYLPFCSESPELAANSSWRLTANAGVVAAALAVPAARAGINTLVFSQHIGVAAKIAKRVSDSLGPCAIELTLQEARWAAISIDELGGTDYLYVDVLDDRITSRAATHHGLLLPEERRLIESVYARPDGLAVLSATATLGQGMNLPSEFVIIAQDSRFDKETGSLELLEARELLNAAGRAGRAGKNATGIVVVIPGQVVGSSDTESKIGAGWSRLRKIFGQTDQCLPIDDPLTQILDRIDVQAHSPDDLDRYVVSRLCGSADHEDPEARLRQALQRTLAAFQRRDARAAWVESRTKAALALLGDVDPDDEDALTLRDLSASLGLPEEALSDLRVDLLDAAPHSSATVLTWCGWMFDWMISHPEQTTRLLRPEDLDRQFGLGLTKLATDQDRVHYAVPKLRDALDLWMKGEPLNVVQSVLAGTPSDLKKSTSARKFVVRILPTLTHLFSAASMIVARQSPDRVTTEDAASTLSYVHQCVRLGFSSLEMYALYEQIRSRTPSRREVHREFRDLDGYLSASAGIESWAEVKARVAAARKSATRR